MPDDNLRILNESALPTEMTWYAPIDIPIEITGGQGGYAVRYIQNPESGMTEEQIGAVADSNFVELAVFKVESTQDTFRLQGTPIPSKPAEVRQYSTKFWLEVTDGNSTILRSFEFEINPLEVERIRLFQDIREGSSDVRSVDVASQSSSRNIICEQNANVVSSPISTAYGMAFPYAVTVKLELPVSIVTEVEYEVRDSSSAKVQATEYTDFLPDKGVLIFNPGDDTCAVIVYVIEDNLIEGAESFEVFIDYSDGAFGDGAESLVIVNIADNEPSLRSFELFYTVSKGASIEVPLVLDTVADSEVIIPFFVNEDETTLAEPDYALQPSSRAVIVEEGEGIGLLNVAVSDAFTSGVDGKLVLEIPNPRDATSPLGKVEVVVNSLDARVPLSSDESLEFVDSVGGGTRGFYTLANVNSNPLSTLRLYKYSDAGVSSSLNNQAFFEISGATKDVKARKIMLLNSDEFKDELLIVFEVEENFGGTTWGGKDFVLMQLSVSSAGVVQEVLRSQHGSELDDTVTNVSVFEDDGSVVISGFTQGKSLDGEAVIPPKDLSEGFVYRLSSDLDVVYRRFVGTNEENKTLAAVSVESGDRVLVTDSDGVYLTALDDDGFDDLDYEDIELRFPAISEFGGFIGFDETRFGLVFSSISAGNGATFSPFEEDVYFYDVAFAKPGSIGSLFSISSPAEDVAIDMVDLGERSTLGLLGETLGAFQEGSSFGGRDVFFSPIDYTSSPRSLTVTQFGTPGEDYAIDIEAVNDEKFLVLWKENHTSGDGTFRYRITPFAPDGTNLAPLSF